ncbi:MAG: hypothetical protein QM535_01700 [Limnohabitans sp.]|nr:hypothetical protein [Limnohabitans sp.]
MLGQKLYLKIDSDNSNEKKIIDSISYKKIFDNTKAIEIEIEEFSQKIMQLGYLSVNKSKTIKLNDSTFVSTFDFGNRINAIHIYIGENFKTLQLQKETQTIAINKVESFMDNCLKILEKKGYSLSRIKLKNFKSLNNQLFADLDLNIEKKRTLDNIIINGYQKFPASHTKNLKRLYKNKIFNQETLKKLSIDVDKFRFSKQIKFPEILFTKDSTQVFIYLEKSKANSFDGFIGFNNNENKFTLTGYLDLKLINILNSGEKLNLYWKSDKNKQNTFDANIELPYIFKSRFGIKAQLNIFKQDSTFQNAKTAIELGHFFNYNTRVYLGYQTTESSDIQNKNNNSLSDYNNEFLTGLFEYKANKIDDYLFPEKTDINIKIGFGTRNTSLDSNKQLFANINLSHNFYINQKNIINLRSQNFYLQSNEYLINELYRFGGINSIRGFNENSIQANFFSSILTEYRYVFNPSFYIHSIIDYGQFQDKSSNNKNSLTGLGFGFGFQTKNGLFNLVYANGNTKNQEIKLSNSIVHISLKAFF